MKYARLPLRLLLAAAALSACGDDEPTVSTDAGRPDGGMSPDAGPTAQTLVDVASKAGFAALLETATVAGLTDTLRADGPFTLFAPTNDAFSALGGNAPTDPGLLANILLHHVVAGDLDAATVTAQSELTSLAGTKLSIDASAAPPRVGGAPLGDPLDVVADNGRIHTVDQVLLPPSVLDAVAAQAQFSVLNEALLEASSELRNRLGATGAITVFAPVDTAFEGLDTRELSTADLDALLGYHVAEGQTLSRELADGQVLTMANGAAVTVRVSEGAVQLVDAAGGRATVTSSDLRLLNGVVHTIDRVLDPKAATDRSVMDVLQSLGLSTLVDAATAAGLAPTLAEVDGLTVFAPTDAALAEVVDALPENPGLLANILLGHVSRGRIESSDVLAAASLSTLAGTTLDVDAAASPPTLAGAPLDPEQLDRRAANGLVHVLDGVILPPSVAEAMRARADLTSLAALVDAAGAPIASGLEGPGPITVFAPLDAAFQGLDTSALSSDPERLRSILGFHVANAQVLSGELQDGQVLEMSTGASVSVHVGQDGIELEDGLGHRAAVLQADLRLANGVVHIIDGLLNPGDVTERAREAGLNVLLQASDRVGLTGALRASNPITVFAPTDAAFESLGVALNAIDDAILSNILLTHVVPGRVDANALWSAAIVPTLARLAIPVDADLRTVGRAEVGSSLDVPASNGLVHIMDEVIVPVSAVELARNVPDLTTLVRALELASASTRATVDPMTLAGGSPITLLAPLDTAFVGIDVETLPTATLDAMLAFHVLPGQVLLEDLPLGASTLTTALGETLSVDKSANGVVTLSDSQGTAQIDVTFRDLRTRSGAVHVINRVLMPRPQ